MTGYSRGKLYRTQLVKTDAGYVARNQLLACLNMLTVDGCVAPDGSLVVACHSGGPDWGSGPTGKGKLYKISYTDQEHPQPVLVWPAGPREVRVEFDRPVDPQLLRDVLAQTKITAGKFVRAGDRFESLWPRLRGRAGARRRRRGSTCRSTRRNSRPTAARWSSRPTRSRRRCTTRSRCPAWAGPTKDSEGRHCRSTPQIDLDFDLSGVEATWKSKDGKTAWTGWLPSLDLARVADVHRRQRPHDALWKAMKKPGELTLKTQARTSTDMLRPGGAARLEDRLRTARREGDAGVRVVRREGPRRDAGSQVVTSRIGDGGCGRHSSRSTRSAGRRPRSSSSSTRRQRDGRRLHVLADVVTDEDKRAAPAPASPRAPPVGRHEGRHRQAGRVAAAEGTRRRQLGARAEGVLQRSRPRARSATRSTARAGTSARTSRTSSTATTPRCCATSRSRASPSTRTTSRRRVHAERRPHAARASSAPSATSSTSATRTARRPIVDKADVASMRPVAALGHAGRPAEEARPGADARPAHVPAHARRRRCRATTSAARSGRSRERSRR